jgi:hypothetical protein
MDIWNRSPVNVSLGFVEITTQTFCDDPCFSTTYNYRVAPPFISSNRENDGLHVVSPNNYGSVPLTPSGSSNPKNTFYPNTSIEVNAGFNQYWPQGDSAYEFRTLRTQITR